jgi:hypothetical protein
MAQDNSRSGGDRWQPFPGGELEGKPATVRCAACLDAFNRGSAVDHGRSGYGTSRARTLCFQCYRAQMDRNRALRAAATLHTASEARFQSQLPFEPVDKLCLRVLKCERSRALEVTFQSHGDRVIRRRHAQIAARHALGRVAADLERRHGGAAADRDRDRAVALALRAAELQFPESWLPFVVAR